VISVSRNIAIAAVLCVLLTASVTGLAAAHTNMGAVSPDGGAEAFSPHASNSCSGTHARVRITDLKADDKAVKAEYYRGADGPYTITETRGPGHTTWSACGARITRVRACTVIPWRPDRCSGWIS
jgi:hypothetical protein